MEFAVKEQVFMQDIKLSDLIDPNILQKVQDTLSKYIGMAGLITDENGTPVTIGSGFTDFCMKLTRQTELGCKRCGECDRLGALKTLASGKPAVYQCHAGLVDYAAPIMLDDTFIGSIIGGQVRTAPLDEANLRKTARELGLNEEDYLEAAKKIPLWEIKDVERAAECLSEIASALSAMAYNNYQALQNSRKLERAAQSQTAFIIDMNASIQRDMTHWIETAKRALNHQDYDYMSHMLRDITVRGAELLSTLKDTVEYVRMSNGEIELKETMYELRNLLNDICVRTQKYLQAEDIPFHIQIDDSVPQRLLGDQGRISQALTKILSNSVNSSGITDITVSAYCKSASYAMLLTIEVRENSNGMTEAELKNAINYIENSSLQLTEDMETDSIGLSIVGLLIRQMSGSVEISSIEGTGTTYTIHIPQLPADRV